jgi:hypothetical protein
MIPDDGTDIRFTSMSLAVAKDSGWYDADLSSGELFFWGKDEGCQMLDNSCKTSLADKFCAEEGHHGCSKNHVYKTNCEQSTYTADCSIYVNRKSCKDPHIPSEKAFAYGGTSMCLAIEVHFFNLSI